GGNPPREALRCSSQAVRDGKRSVGCRLELDITVELQNAVFRKMRSEGCRPVATPDEWRGLRDNQGHMPKSALCQTLLRNERLRPRFVRLAHPGLAGDLSAAVRGPSTRIPPTAYARRRTACPRPRTCARVPNVDLRPQVPSPSPCCKNASCRAGLDGKLHQQLLRDKRRAVRADATFPVIRHAAGEEQSW